MHQANADKEAIESILAEQVTAWNNGDAKTFARAFAADGTFTNLLGMFFTGQQAFRERHHQVLQSVFRKTNLHQKLVALRFVHPHTAIVETFMQLSGCTNPGALPGVYIDAQGTLHTRLLQVMVKEPHGWKIVAYHNVDVKAGIPLSPPL